MPMAGGYDSPLHYFSLPNRFSVIDCQPATWSSLSFPNKTKPHFALPRPIGPIWLDLAILVWTAMTPSEMRYTATH